MGLDWALSDAIFFYKVEVPMKGVVYSFELEGSGVVMIMDALSRMTLII